MRLSFLQAVKKLQEPKVLAIPTETVYGLAAPLASEEAILSIFKLKKRPAENPLIVHLSKFSEAKPLMSDTPPFFTELASQFWPGPLTLVVPASEQVPMVVRGGLPTVGLRIPNHPLTLNLIEKTGPLVAPSANLSGRPSSTHPEHVEKDFGCDFPVLDGGCCSGGIESTILIFQNGKWHLGRLGAVTPSQIEQVLGYTPEEVRTEKPLCPGQMFRHYSPRAKLTLKKPDQFNVVVGFEGRDYKGAQKIFTLGNLKNPESIAQNLYQTLRQLDTEGVEEAWVDFDFPKEGLLLTISERLSRALALDLLSPFP